MMQRLRSALDPQSVRTRLMVWNICMFALLLAVLGAIVQFTVETVLQNAVDRDLEKNTITLMGQAHEFLLRDRGLDPDGRARGGPHGPFSGPPGGPSPDEHARSAGGSPPDGQAKPPGNGQPTDLNRPAGGQPHDEQRRLSGGSHPANLTGPPGDPPRDDRRPFGQSTLLREEQRRQSLVPRIFNFAGVAMRPYEKAGAWDGMAVHHALKGEASLTTVTIDGEPVRVLTRPVRWRGQVLGAVQAAHPLGETREAIASVKQTLLALIPVGLLFAGSAGAIVTGRALQPVGKIARTADRIDAQDLTQRLDVSGSDEFSHLAATFNRMLGRLEGAFAQQKALVTQLETLLEEQKRFTADASHELKTPLSVAKVHAGLLLHTQPTAQEFRESAESIENAVDRMSHLVQDLLLLAQADAGQLNRRRTALVVYDLLHQARQLQSGSPGAPIVIAPADGGLTVVGDEDKLVRVFANLLANARRHTPEDGEIRVCAAERDGQVVVRIADTGEGIAPEHLPHLGDRFYRVDSARGRGQGGVGLGLSICKSLLEQHHGSMAFESVVGKGTTVTVTLPAASAP